MNHKTPRIRFTRLLYAIIALSPLLPSCNNTDTTGIPGIDHVVMIGVDGLSPDGIIKARTPHIDALITQGAHTFRSRGVMPTSSGPNWASILMGAGPEQHGVTGNSFDPLEPELPPVVSGNGERKLFPNIFEVIKHTEPGAKVAAIHHWDGVAAYYQKEHLDYAISPETQGETADLAIDYILQNKPKYCFIHFDDVDQAGHSQGHGSQAYYQAVEEVDTLVGKIVKALDASGLRQNTMIVFTADHGGLGFGHNEAVPEVISVPFILNGPGVKKGYVIKETVNAIDNSPTVAFALGISVPEAWTGWPVKSAFKGFEEPAGIYETKTFISSPDIYPLGRGFVPSGGLYVNELPVVKMDTSMEHGTVIRYTLDGRDPRSNSQAYTKSFELDRTTVVKAAKFMAEAQVSRIRTAYFRVVENDGQKGIRAKFHYGKQLEALPDFDRLDPVGETVQVLEFTDNGLILPQGPDQLAMTFESYLQVDKEGAYTFYLTSDDGSKLYINDQVVVDHDGNHGMREKEGTIDLAPGRHKVEVQWYNSGGGMGLYTFFKGPGIPKQILTSDRLYLNRNYLNSN